MGKIDIDGVLMSKSHNIALREDMSEASPNSTVLRQVRPLDESSQGYM